jgi:putative protein-disulfide isomerase
MPTLYYVHDPMCSWCYAFAPTWRRIEAALPDALEVRCVLGGLAPDSDHPMPAQLQAYIQNTWRRIAATVPGTVFNFDFWTRCSPRRSTYPACRAVTTAKRFAAQHEQPMIARIQTAYYREARNPADLDTLCALAGEIGLDAEAFRDFIVGAECQTLLEQDLQLMRELGIQGFPSLVLEVGESRGAIPLDYLDPNVTLGAIRTAIN